MPEPKLLWPCRIPISLKHSVETWKVKLTTTYLDVALQRKPQERPSRPVIFDGAFEAKLTQLVCSSPPEGYSRWTVRLLADKLVELEVVERVSAMTVQRTLKKTGLSLT